MEIISSRLLLILWTVPASTTITTSMLDIQAVDSAITEDQTLVEGIIGVAEDTLIAVEGSIMEDATSVEDIGVAFNWKAIYCLQSKLFDFMLKINDFLNSLLH